MKSLLLDFFLCIAMFFAWFAITFGPLVVAVGWFEQSKMIGFLSLIWMIAAGLATAFVLHNCRKGEYE